MTRLRRRDVERRCARQRVDERRIQRFDLIEQFGERAQIGRELRAIPGRDIRSPGPNSGPCTSCSSTRLLRSARAHLASPFASPTRESANVANRATVQAKTRNEGRSLL